MTQQDKDDLHELARQILAKETRFAQIATADALAQNGGKANANAQLQWPLAIDAAGAVEKDIQKALSTPRVGPAILKRVLEGAISLSGHDADKDAPVFSAKARLWHNAFIGKTGSGKTYAARGEVEDLLDLGEQVVIIDPTGAWPGLRSNPDGTPSGYPVAIFGGAHGDRPLTPDMAPALGRIAGTTTQSMILDLSGISLELEDQREIVHQFLRNLYRTNRKPIHLVIDESDEFAPQQLDKDTKDLRTLVARIMARGRSLGFRCTLITQRPAKIDKNSISQVESMAVLRVTAPQDRNAIVDWFADKGGADRKEILSGLGSLETGEGWVFTGLDGTYEHRRFRLVRTYDTSSTPVDAEGHGKDIDTGPIDLAELDEKIVYPEETSEEELERAITKRRNLEEDNRRLRARLLKSEARYEAMRRVFVQIRRVTEETFIEDGLEAVDYADLVLLRNEVEEDNRIAFDMNDVAGVPSDISADANGADPLAGFDMITEWLPHRSLTPAEKAIIDEIALRPSTRAEIAKRSDASDTVIDNSLARLVEEESLYEEDGVYEIAPSAYARQMSSAHAKVAQRLVIDPNDDLDGIRAGTRSAMQRLGFLDKSLRLTPRGQEAIAIVSKVHPHWIEDLTLGK